MLHSTYTNTLPWLRWSPTVVLERHISPANCSARRHTQLSSQDVPHPADMVLLDSWVWLTKDPPLSFKLAACLP